MSEDIRLKEKVMRYELTVNTLKDLRSRFHEFPDSEIVDVEFKLSGSQSQTSAIVIILAQDGNTLKKTTSGNELEMVKVQFEIEGLTKFIVKQIQDFRLILISYVTIGFFDNNVYLDFQPSDGKETDIESFSLETNYVRNHCLIGGNRCFWTIIDS
jgi:hypothetical protein